MVGHTDSFGKKLNEMSNRSLESDVCECMLSHFSSVRFCDPMDYSHRLLCPWDSLDKGYWNELPCPSLGQSDDSWLKSFLCQLFDSLSVSVPSILSTVLCCIDTIAFALFVVIEVNKFSSSLQKTCDKKKKGKFTGATLKSVLLIPCQKYLTIFRSQKIELKTKLGISLLATKTRIKFRKLELCLNHFYIATERSEILFYSGHLN